MDKAPCGRQTLGARQRRQGRFHPGSDGLEACSFPGDGERPFFGQSGASPDAFRGALPAEVLTSEGKLNAEVFKVVQEKKIDLLLLRAHAEWQLEHILFGHGNEEIIRKMPCSILLVKDEPKPVPY